MAKDPKKDREMLAYLTERLGIKTNPQLAIATPDRLAEARMFDGSLTVKVIPTFGGGVRVESPKAPGVYIQLVDHQRDYAAPAEAIYEITAYKPDEKGGTTLNNGEVYSVYVGPRGIVLGAAEKAGLARLLNQSERKT